ncbi:probable elongator complex protein 2 [Sitophilus oryzae]|uniref:Elongator complex protein 2 n=1 Tax=Sitophilus oryzae TaxID=7048 RepID=A0A6J2YRH7_SITOR|nr:probable elongator complex protein 2 [Sitophilus oryzae]
MHFKNSYISSNCNPVPTTALDCSYKNIIAYGSCNAVLVYDPQYGSGGKVIYTLVGHSNRVNSVRWIRGSIPDKSQELISGASDGNIIVWTFKNDKYHSAYLYDKELPKTLSVNIVDGYYKDHSTVVCNAVIDDNSIRIWRREFSDDFQLQQRFLFGSNNPRICVGLRIGIFSDNNLIISCGLDNSKIELLVEQNKTWTVLDRLSGHDDWVIGLDFYTEDNGDLLLASSSQDSSIRIWRLTLKDNSLTVYLESVLSGHEGWVYSVNWSQKYKQLLSASIDKSMIIWEFDSNSGLWMEKIRVGEVGGNTLGFGSGLFNSTSEEIIAYSYHGAFHIWTKNAQDLWDSMVTVGGHFDEVVDLSWDPKGDFLYSVSSDQTARIHAPYQKLKKDVTWHEIARPQVHGYDLSSIAVISRYMYASGAEEKVIRVFEAPETYINNLNRICQLEEEGRDISSVPKGASVPSLGLSNKAVYTEDNIDDTLPIDNKNPYPEESHFVAQVLSEPPTEEVLLQNTLWPEIQKLYGHGYEIFSLAASPDGKYLASACKSTKLQHAAIFIWDTSNWEQIQSLQSHNLTVVQMQFSPDSQNLLSVSRDRRWSLFSKNGTGLFDLVSTTNKETGVHTRIIWTCAWTHDSQYFATGSRDGKLVLWHKNVQLESVPPLGQVRQATSPLEFPNESVTAVAFGPGFLEEAYIVAVGFENGTIDLFKITNLTFDKIGHLSTEFAHHLTVRKLVFRPQFGEAGQKKDANSKILQLASCSNDHSVRIYDITV